MSGWRPNAKIWRPLLKLAILSVPLWGCQETPTTAEKPDPALEAHIIEEVPGDLENPLRINFEDKVHLIGYKLEPAAERAAPGSRLTLTLYWRSVDRLSPGWSLFTHVLDGSGQQIGNFDNVGPIRAIVKGANGKERQALPPSLWQPGKIYVDRQEIEISRKVTTPEVSIAVGLWRRFGNRDDIRLDVIGGETDGENRGLVTKLNTGLKMKQPSEASEKSKS